MTPARGVILSWQPGLFLAETQSARAVNGEDQHATGNGQVLHEHDGLHLITEIAMEDECRDDGESRQGIGNPACLPADDERQGSADFQQDHER